MRKIRWGILSTARIGTRLVIPAMQAGSYSEVIAIASRDEAKAKSVAASLNIPKAYGSYEALLTDPDIEAIYNPLPNHLHAPWSIRCLEAGKHVLCEKPIALDAAEARQLLEAAGEYPHLKIMEAFMYRQHLQWQMARRLVIDGEIGELRTIQSFFSYFNADPDNIRNKPEMGGGGLMDIGCYPISLSRFIFGREPQRVFGIADFDPVFQTDRLTSGILDFETGTSTFTCSMQLEAWQRVNIFGTEGRVELEIPFNPPVNQPSRILHQRKGKLREITLEACNQYTIQGDSFSQAILNDGLVATPLEDAVANMEVIDLLFESARIGTWAGYARDLPASL